MNKQQQFIFENLGALVKKIPNLRLHVEQPYFNENTYFVEYSWKNSNPTEKELRCIKIFDYILFPEILKMQASLIFSKVGEIDIDKNRIIFSINY